MFLTRCLKFDEHPGWWDYKKYRPKLISYSSGKYWLLLTVQDASYTELLGFSCANCSMLRWNHLQYCSNRQRVYFLNRVKENLKSLYFHSMTWVSHIRCDDGYPRWTNSRDLYHDMWEMVPNLVENKNERHQLTTRALYTKFLCVSFTCGASLQPINLPICKGLKQIAICIRFAKPWWWNVIPFINLKKNTNHVVLL